MNIIDAIKDPHLFRSYLVNDTGSLKSWRTWLALLKVLYGLPIPNPTEREFIRKLIKKHKYVATEAAGYSTGLILTGRRSGKSRISSIIAAYEAALVPTAGRLAKGEPGLVAVISPTKQQSRVIAEYVRGIFEIPLLANEVVRQTPTSVELRNGNRIEILAGNYATVRGYTLLAAIVDEIAFFGMEETFSVRSDTELIRAVKPALATTRGKLIAIGSPYGRRGWAYNTAKKYEGKHDKAHQDTLVVRAPSRTMNDTLPERLVKQALDEDYASAKAEYLAEWRDDVALLIPRHLIEKVVIKDRRELLPRDGIRYFGFVDVSGGRGDGSALAIGHQHNRKVILDACYHWTAPHDPYRIVACMAEELRRFRVRRVTGDNYAAEFVARSFTGQGIRYEKSAQAKSALYLELLPTITSHSVELLDNELLINQLANLERRTRVGGKDTVDHPRGGHDDLVNAVAGLVTIASHTRRRVGGFQQADII